MTINANCKINIGLDIVEKREDGYHNIESVMYPIHGLYDTIEINPSTTPKFRNVGLEVDCPPSQNICLKSYELMRDRYGVAPVEITLQKNIPFGAGLGGGSADATAIIMSIDTLYKLQLSTDELIDCAAQLGSDTPFFVHNTPQLCTGRGEIMTPIELDLSGKWIVMIKPDCNVSTKEAYSGVIPHYPEIALRSSLQQPIEEWSKTVKNDFEPHIFRNHPELAQIKQQLKTQGAVYTAMSGSGSTIFGIFDNKHQAEQFRPTTPYIYAL